MFKLKVSNKSRYIIDKVINYNHPDFMVKFLLISKYLILGLDVLDEIDDSAGITEFVVIPADKLDKVVV